MTRGERTGLSLALMGHVALLAMLSLKFLIDTPMPDIVQEPMGVELVDEADLGSGLPSPAPLAGALPDNQPAPVPDAVPMPTGPTPAELAAEAARKKRRCTGGGSAARKQQHEAKAAAGSRSERSPLPNGLRNNRGMPPPPRLRC
jgi:hypothetical protein